MENTSPLKIFFVDDDLFCLRMYELHLGVLGYKDVSLYLDEQACLDNLVRQPDIVFMDHDIEKQEDCRLLKEIKKFNSDIYVVLLCSPESIEKTNQAFQYGAFDFIVKSENDLDEMKSMLIRIKEIKELLNSSRVFPERKLF